jgi:hypothetical protein
VHSLYSRHEIHSYLTSYSSNVYKYGEPRKELLSVVSLAELRNILPDWKKISSQSEE